MKTYTTDRREKKRHTVLYGILFMAALAVFLYAAYELFNIYKANYEEADERDRVEELASIKKNEPFSVDFAALQRVNPDVAGWIIIPGTQINYPILIGTDNDFYLTHTFEKAYNYAGSIFLDYQQNRNFSDPNTFIYGHNVKHGTMFAELENFLDPKFYEDHPYIYLYTPAGNYRCEIMSMYDTVVGSASYVIGFAHDQRLVAYADMVKGLSIHKREVSFTAQDSMITLSTCSYDAQGDEARYLLHAKLVPWSGEYIMETESERN